MTARRNPVRRVASFLAVIVFILVTWELAKLLAGDPWRSAARPYRSGIHHSAGNLSTT